MQNLFVVFHGVSQVRKLFILRRSSVLVLLVGMEMGYCMLLAEGTRLFGGSDLKVERGCVHRKEYC